MSQQKDDIVTSDRPAAECVSTASQRPTSDLDYNLASVNTDSVREINNGGNYRKFSTRQRTKCEKIEDSEACGFQISCCNAKKRYKTPFLQRLATTRFAMVVICTAYIFSEGMMNGVFNVTITTVEKQFQLRTLEAGLTGGFIDIGAFIALAISSYLGDKILKPVWMGWGLSTCAVGCLVFALPQFTSPTYSYGEVELNYCGNVTAVECKDSSLRNHIYTFMFGTFLIGFGGQYIQTLGAPYMDENVKQVNSSFYTGIFFCCGAVGAALGYFVGGATLSLFNNPQEEVHITPSSSLWVGAWWVSYVVGAITLILFAFPVIFLPKSLPNTTDVRKNREQMRPSSENRDGKSGHFGRRLLCLAKNGTFVFLTLSDCANLAFIIGFMTYAIKIGEHMFGLSDATSAYYMGAAAISASAAGFFFGGIVVTKLKLTLRGILLFILGGSIVSFLFCFGFLLTCSEREFVGATIPYVGQNLTVSLDAECNSACGCTADLFNPVCDENGLTYFSPCFAGCHSQVDDTVFSDCLCLTNQNSTGVSRENCPNSACSYLATVMPIMFVSFFTGFLIITPKSQATMRCVAFDERTAALSVQKIVIILLGRLLGRLSLGEALELTCLTSSTDCGEKGACRVYTRKDMGRNITILFAAERFLCVVFSALAWIAYKRRKDLTRPDDDRALSEH